MNPATLNRRIQVQTQSSGQDALGSPVNVWTTAYSCWAAINFKDGKQLFSANQFADKTTLDIIVRWISSFTFAPNQRVVYTDALGTHVYNIEAISNDNQANKLVRLSVYELDGKE